MVRGVLEMGGCWVVLEIDGHEREDVSVELVVSCVGDCSCAWMYVARVFQIFCSLPFCTSGVYQIGITMRWEEVDGASSQ